MPSLKQGHLGNVTVVSPAVHWRPGLRPDPRDPTKPKRTGPMVTWDSLKLSKGTVDIANPGQFSFSGSMSGEGRSGAWHHEGRLALAPQDLVFTSPEYQMTLTEGPVGAVHVAAGEIKLQASVEGTTGILSISSPRLTGARLQLTKAPEPVLPRIGAVSSPAGKKSDGQADGPPVVSGVRLVGLKAPSLEIAAALPWAMSGRGDLSLESLTAGNGLPFGMTDVKFDQASATLPESATLPKFSLAGSYQAGSPFLDGLTISDAAVPDLAALLRHWGIAPDSFPAVSFNANATLTGLALKDGRPTSSTEQKLTLTNLRIAIPGQGKATASRLTVQAVPDEVLTDRRLRLVELSSPQADLILQSTIAELTQTVAPQQAGTPPPALGTASPRAPWEGWTADILTLTDGTFAATLPQAGNSRVTTGLTIRTPLPVAVSAAAPETPAGAMPGLPAAPAYQITLDKPQLVHPDFPTQPIALASAIQLTASAAGLWQRREIESLVLAGSQLQIGEAIFRLVKALPPSPPAPDPPTTSSIPPPTAPSEPWRLRSLVLDNTLVQLDHLGDGRRLDIPIKRQEFRNLPLDTTALATVDRLYKIEVPNITLYNPWVEGQKAAVLDTNYIQFTPSGLLNRRLERVDLMLPSLYAGVALFNFVDATRQHFEKIASAKPEPSPRAPLLVDNTPGSPTVLSALASVTPSTAAAAADWHIPFYTESGKVYVAPKGFPWPNLPVIPFRNARDAKGKPIPFLLRGETFHGELAVDPGWYDFPEYKVRLRLSDLGRIIFNTPQKDRDNNLTEVFENNTLIFRKLRLDEVWLSITYDANGIYAKFGGLTCGGTINGGFNLYLDELYTWDAWASLVGINMKPLTDKLTPDTFRMTGPVDELTVKAYGDTTTLYQAILELGVTKPGLLHILALDSMKQELATMGSLSGDLGQIGLDTLRDFSYTGCTGSLKLFGTEGHGHLHLTGPAGSRTFNLRLHDYRVRIPKSMAPF